MPPLPRIALTMGDPAGVGPELCLRLLAEPNIAAVCTPVIFGDAAVLHQVAARCDLPAPAGEVADIPGLDVPFVPGRVSAACGLAAFRYVEAAIAAALAGEVAAVVTAPIHKEAWK